MDDWLAPLACSSLRLSCATRRCSGAAQGVLQLRVQRQHFGQGAVAVDALGQRLPVQGQLALHAVAFGVQ